MRGGDSSEVRPWLGWQTCMGRGIGVSAWLVVSRMHGGLARLAFELDADAQWHLPNTLTAQTC